MSETMSDKYLIKKIKVLKRSAIQHRNNNEPGQRRYWMYGYLQDVYAAFLEIQAKGTSKKAARRIVKLQKMPIKRKSHLLRVLIEASAGAEDNRTKIKWASALRYAFGWLQPAERLDWFFEVNGGIAGSAAKFAFLQKVRRQKRLQNREVSLPKTLSVDSRPVANQNMIVA
jgi:hypothetical protein